MMNFAVFASGRGGNLQAIHKAVKSGKIKARLALVFSDKKDAYALEYATKEGIATLHLNPKEFETRETFDREIVKHLRRAKIDFVVLAGYMRLVSGYFVEQYPDKILNIHPSLLPSFKGMHAIKDAFEYGAKVTGPTVHFVVEQMDEGALILQEPVAVESKDTYETLKLKIHEAEHRIYPKAIDLFVRGKLKIEGRKVIVL